MAEADSTVQFRDVPGYPGYRVDDQGGVWRRWVTCRTGRKLSDRWRPMKLAVQKGRTVGRTYVSVNLVPPEGSKYRTFRVHRLVLEAFVGSCPPGMQCRHVNGNPQDNRLENLRWGTPAENRQDNHDNGAYLLGEQHWMAKLTEAQVREIRAHFKAGVTQASLARVYGVGQANIAAIVERRSWKHLD